MRHCYIVKGTNLRFWEGGGVHIKSCESEVWELSRPCTMLSGLGVHRENLLIRSLPSCEFHRWPFNWSVCLIHSHRWMLWCQIFTEYSCLQFENLRDSLTDIFQVADLSDQPTLPCLVKKFSAFYGTLQFITVCTAAHHLFLSWVRWTQSMSSHPIYLRSI